jgi:hypothetical protein
MAAMPAKTNPVTGCISLSLLQPTHVSGRQNKKSAIIYEYYLDKIVYHFQ